MVKYALWAGEYHPCEVNMLNCDGTATVHFPELDIWALIDQKDIYDVRP